jgi:hypothetical protein
MLRHAAAYLNDPSDRLRADLFVVGVGPNVSVEYIANADRFETAS